jgi:hypothetical protein
MISSDESGNEQWGNPQQTADINSSYKSARVVIRKFEKYHFMNQQQKEAIDAIIANEHLNYFTKRARGLYVIMQDEYLWGLALVVAYAKRIYSRSLRERHVNDEAGFINHIPPELVQECEAHFAEWTSQK